MRLVQVSLQDHRGSRSAALYGTTTITERHRHRYEFNNDYNLSFTLRGMRLVGLSPTAVYVEIIENPNHPWFVGVQFIHSSRPPQQATRCSSALSRRLSNTAKVPSKAPI
jgi:CTP synthase